MKEKKITVIGDIMGEYPVLAQAEKEDGTFDFLPAFAPLKSLFDEADYGIGNLETVMAGEEAGYTKNIYSFNTPDAICQALRSIGLDAVTTANNHIFDRGMGGLRRSCRVLDAAGLAHTGTYDDIPEDRNLYFTLGDTTVALLSYTTSCNYGSNKNYDPTGLYEHANFLKPYDGCSIRESESPAVVRTFRLVERIAGRKLEFEEKAELRRSIGQPVAYADHLYDSAAQLPFLERLREDYAKARAKADIVIICPHSGGQFNTETGRASRWLYERISEMGFDAILSAHSHTTQRAEKYGNTVVFQSLGNVTMSPHTGYSVPESLPQYGMAAHLYIGEKKVQRVAFSLFKMVEPEGGRLQAVPVDEMYASLPEGLEKAQLLTETAQVFERISGRRFERIEREWPLF